MKTEDLRKLGDHSKALEMLRLLDMMLSWTGDPALFKGTKRGMVEAIVDNLLQARVAVSNLLIDFEDLRGVENPPPKQKRSQAETGGKNEGE